MSPARHALLALVLAAAPATAADAPRPDAAIGYRQAVFRMILWNYQPMTEMLRGRRPFEAEEFRRRAVRLAFLAQQLGEGFPEGSDKGATTDALPAIWSSKPDFDRIMDDFVRESKALREAAKTGEQAQIKDKFAKTTATCKACHDKYRAD